MSKAGSSALDLPTFFPPPVSIVLRLYHIEAFIIALYLELSIPQNSDELLGMQVTLSHIVQSKRPIGLTFH